MKKTLFTVLFIIAMTIVNATNVVITGNGVRLRYSPSLNSNVYCTLNKGTKLTYYETVGDWYKVGYKGYTLYVSRDFASLCNTETSNSKYTQIVVHASDLRLRTGPGTEYPYLIWTETGATVHLNHGEVLPYLGVKKNGFYKVKYQETVCWVSAKYVSLR